MIRIFFCHQYSSWEKGTVENTNREIMVFLLKGSDISLKTLSFFRTAEKKVNSRFMECLEYRTPDEVLLRCRKQKEARGFCNEKRNGERSN